MDRKTLYEILEVPQEASTEAILRAYEAKKSTLERAFEGEALSIVMAVLNHARDQLLDPARRALYDEMLLNTNGPD